MGKKKRKFLKRLDRLERRVAEHAGEHRDGASDHRGGKRRRGDFDEKRVIDTVVRLVVERVARVVQKELQANRRQEHDSLHNGHGDHHHRGHHEDRRHANGRDGDDPGRRRDEHRGREGDYPGRPRDEHRGRDGREQGDGGGEKRIVDLIVGLVSEHVEEIVAAELDRRLGPPREDIDVEARHDGDEGDRPPPSEPKAGED